MEGAYKLSSAIPKAEVVQLQQLKQRPAIATQKYYISTTTMELESDTYDVVVIGTGLAESLAAA